ncbi:MAG TPA: hypothetical protein VMY37_28450, partial [Thermoguttaceae bacterium]|nr:hypothetical protein [Thermoguttaceae bacterium]
MPQARMAKSSLDRARERLRLLAGARAWNIAFRTAHIAAAGILLGGHAFNLPRERLLPSLWLTIGTGIGLGLLEAGPRLLWFHQGRGLMTLAKLGLLSAVPFLWDHWHLRIAVLLTVVALASVGSHMSARFRYYSVIYREVIPCRGGPGTSQLDDEPNQDSIAESLKHTDEHEQ